MGEIADMMIDGTLDYRTGEYLGQGQGFPRTRRTPTKGKYAIRGVRMFVRKYYKTKKQLSPINLQFLVKSTVLLYKPDLSSNKDYKDICEFIQKDWLTFQRNFQRHHSTLYKKLKE